MSVYRSIYGNVEFKNPLTLCEVAMIYDLTGNNYDVGDTEIEFVDTGFNLPIFVDWLETKEIVEGSIYDYGGYGEAYIYNSDTKKWWVYGKEFVFDVDNETLIRELESRGYTVTKEGE